MKETSLLHPVSKLFVISSATVQVAPDILKAQVILSDSQNCRKTCYRRTRAGTILDFNTLSANPTTWSNKPKQFVANSRRIALVCLTILWGWRLKG